MKNPAPDRPAPDPGMRARLAQAAFAGSGEAAFSLGYELTGPGSPDMERGLYWYLHAARLGDVCAVFNAAIVAAEVARDCPDDLKAAERALGWLWLAMDEWPERAGILQSLRLDILTLWPELEPWEFEASCDVYEDISGLMH